MTKRKLMKMRKEALKERGIIMSESIKQILIRRDNMTELEADDLIQQAFEAFYDYVAAGDNDYAEKVCSEYFGLEPDYLEELLTL